MARSVSANHHPKLSQQLITTIMTFARHTKDSDEVLQKSVIPILTQLGNAPKTSPLGDINTNNAVAFLAAITSFTDRPHVRNHFFTATLQVTIDFFVDVCEDAL